MPAHLDGELGSDDAIHGGGDDRSVETAAAELPGDVDLRGIDGEGARDESDIVEPVCRSRFPSAPDPHAHRSTSCSQDYMSRCRDRRRAVYQISCSISAAPRGVN